MQHNTTPPQPKEQLIALMAKTMNALRYAHIEFEELKRVSRPSIDDEELFYETVDTIQKVISIYRNKLDNYERFTLSHVKNRKS